MENFLEEHQKAFGEGSRPDRFGAPDAGCGRYSQALDYKGWYEFNSTFRAHYN